MSTPNDISCVDDVKSLVKEFSKDSNVILIDTNIRNNSNKEGYSNLLKNYTDISKYINKENGIDIIYSGTINEEPELLLSSENNKKIINDLKEKYDYVILFNSNIASYSDSLILSKLSDNNYILVGIDKTDKNDFEKSINMFKQVNTDINGIIILDDNGFKTFNRKSV